MKYKKIILSIFILLLIISFEHVVNAKSSILAKDNIIHNISMDINITDNGDALVTEYWDCTINNNTYLSHNYPTKLPFSFNVNILSKIEDLKVSENDNYFENVSSFDINSNSLYVNKNKCFINHDVNSYNIYWGLGSYGKHTYKLEYTLKDFVTNLSDSQAIYTTLIPTYPEDQLYKIQNFNIRIYSKVFNENFNDIWEISNNKVLFNKNKSFIEISNSKPLVVGSARNTKSTTPNVSVIIKLPSNTYSTKASYNYTFTKFRKMADSKIYSFLNTYNLNLKTSLIIWVPILIFMVLIIIFVIKLDKYLKSKEKNRKRSK